MKQLRKGIRIQDNRDNPGQIWKVVGIEDDEHGGEIELHLQGGTAEWIADLVELKERIAKKEFTIL